MINKDIYFIEENAGFEELTSESLKFASYLKKCGKKEIKIFLSSTFDFCVALFGAMIANTKAHVVSDERLCDIGDLNFAKCKVDKEGEFFLNTNYKFYLYTSGSSGSSKIIEKSIKDMFEEANFLRNFIKMDGKKVYTSVTHQHMFGLTFKVFLPLVAGMKVLSSRLDYPELIFAYDFTDSIFISSPVVLSAVSKYDNICLNTASLIVSAGSKLSDDIRDKFTSKIMEIYGSTETGVVASNFGSGFVIFDAVNADIKDDRLFINSKWCDNFLSSDMAEIHGKDLKLLGRSDRIIKLNETRFSLDEAESFLKDHTFIKDAKCALLKNDKRVKALLVLSDDGKNEFRNNGKLSIVDTIKKYLYPKFKTNIRSFKIISEIPKNSYGKFSISEFQKCYDEKKIPSFSLLQSDEKIAKFSCFMSEDCFFFEGHFREFPLTPGFIQLGFVFECLDIYGIKIDGGYVLENLKFMAFLRPFDRCIIEICITDKNINFKIFANETQCCSGRIKVV
ncbi:AMP-binding protein [Campylobacter hyointestinalis]|uniref:AMP-binding protein n=1 Tax=Campylobacter hyointestinalis TaxID=198 RepID=UPI000726BCB3|nr:AMP-binding protein [Campylobacter hyointestinalis]CUU74513.1 3-phosphoshikimate 1-carboxyvinyltransferase [Campylobacter hyointestinalis subsp. hyointestinalis]